MNKQKMVDNAQCSVCQKVFGCADEFDTHRDHGKCLDPNALDMIQTNGVWVATLRHPAPAKTGLRRTFQAPTNRLPGTSNTTQQPLFTAR